MATAAPSPSVSIDHLKQSLRASWMAGDFGVVARMISGGAEAFVDRLAFPAGTSVLDIACGTGNTAIPLARRGCVVTGVDIATNLLAQARERAAAEGLTITFDEGDAEQLPYPDASFDAIVTMFGAMFAPRPELVAAEFARVLRPGGRLAMANWNPASFSGTTFKVMSFHVPPPPSVPPPLLWGDESTVRQRLAANFTGIQTQIIPIDFELPTNPAGVVEFFRKYFGPTQIAFSRLDAAGQSALAADLESAWSDANDSPTPDTSTLVHNQYLQVTATRA
jgi:SAM-dependent methyltransferase